MASSVPFLPEFTWTFRAPCNVPADVVYTLAPGEEAICAYKTVRDVAVITNKRIILRDTEGITGKKVETYSLPFSSIRMYSCENAGVVDFNSELEIWTSVGHIKINLSRGVDIRELDRIIAEAIL